MYRAATISFVAVAGLAATVWAEPMRQGARLSHAPVRPLPGVTDGPGNWSDNFNSYANGSQLIGQGGWVGWTGCGTATPYSCYTNNNPTAFASNAQSASAPNSCRLALANATATPPTDQSDFVHLYNISGGQWVYRIKTYMPSTAIATTAPYFIVLRGYDTTSQANDHWSIQTHFDKLSGQVTQDTWMGGGFGTFTPVPLILDQWVDVRAEINLDVQDGNLNVFYNNQPVVMNQKWVDTAGIGSLPPYTIQAVDLYNDGVDVFYFDDASLTAVSNCYANCDGSTGNPFLTINDFVCFQAKFAAGDPYANCDNSTIPPILTVNDFICFQGKFAAGCSAP